MKLERLFRALVSALALSVACGSWLFLWPVPVDPEVWEPPPDPGVSPTTPLDLTVGRAAPGEGVEDVEIDAEGRIYGGTQDGTIWRWDTPDAEPVAFVNTGGRPLGLTFDAGGQLLVADAFRGLLAVSMDDRRIRVLATRCGERELVFTDDLEVDRAGRIWFTDASQRFDQHHWRVDLLENRPSGRLCVFDPSRPGQAKEVLDGLAFANGVAVDPEGRFVLIAETARYRVRRYWTSGDQVGTVDTLIDGLPGFPDGISQGTGGEFWIALASPRDPGLDGIAHAPWIRSLVVRLPESLGPAPARVTHVLGVDGEGRILHDLHDPTGSRFAVVTSVEERGDRLLLGSLAESTWASLPRP